MCLLSGACSLVTLDKIECMDALSIYNINSQLNPQLSVSLEGVRKHVHTHRVSKLVLVVDTVFEVNAHFSIAGPLQLVTILAAAEDCQRLTATDTLEQRYTAAKQHVVDGVRS